MTKYLAAIAAATVLAMPVAAEPTKMSGSSLRGFVSGKTVVLNTKMGTIPISYRGNGTMSGRAKSLAGFMGPPQDQGNWWIQGEQVCQKWNTWLDGQAHCITFRLDGKTVHWRSNDGHEGIATIASN